MWRVLLATFGRFYSKLHLGLGEQSVETANKWAIHMHGKMPKYARENVAILGDAVCRYHFLYARSLPSRINPVVSSLSFERRIDD